MYTLCRNNSESDLIRAHVNGNAACNSPASSRPPSPRRRRSPSPPNTPLFSLTPAQFATLDSLQKRISSGEICAQVRSLLDRPITELPIYIDLPRLAHRVVLHDHDVGVTTRSPLTCPSSNFKDDSLRWRSSLAWLASAVALRVEGPDKAASIAAWCATHSSSSQDAGSWTEALFDSCIGADSRTAFLLKSLNQSIIGPMATELKILLLSTTGQMTKDSRAPSGWEIVLDFHETAQRLYVTHARTELGSCDDFELQWRLKLTFDLSSSRPLVSDVSFKLCELTVLKDISEDLKGRLMATVRSLSPTEHR